MKMIQQLLVADGHISNNALTQDGASVLGKYIIGAKNNFRGFSSRPDDKNTSLKVSVHHGAERVDEEKVDQDAQQETDKVSQVDDREEELKQVTDCEVVNMEEGQAKSERDAEKRDLAEEQPSKNGNKEEEARGRSFDDVEEKVETMQCETDSRSDEEVNTRSRGTERHMETEPEHTESTTVSCEVTDTMKIINKFKDMELMERKTETGRMKGNRFEKKARERGKQSGNKEVIPSPTGSSSSHDTGFGSQEGEGAIDGAPVRP